MVKFIEPNTDQWRNERLGCFTSSENYRLFKGGSRKMTQQELNRREKGDRRSTVDTMFGAGAMTYINEKVAEIINKRPKFVPTTKPMERGLMLEQDALDLFYKITGIKFQLSGLYKLNSYTAGTPDAQFGKRKVTKIAEIKCFNPETFSEISELNTVEEIREYDEAIYCQCQSNLYVTGAKECYLIFFDPRAMGVGEDGEIIEEIFDADKFIFCIKFFKIKRDETFISELKTRLDAAVGVVVSKLEKRMKTASQNLKMYNRTQKRLNKAA